MADENNYPPIGELDPNTDTIPLYDAERGFRVWNEDERYKGPKKKGKYVPNVDDMIVDWVNGLQRVIEVDYTTGFSRVKKWDDPHSTSENPEYDTILGAGPGLFQSEAQRIYFNGAVTPHTLNVDRQLFVYGREVKWCKIFRGYDVSANGDVIGLWFDGNGVDANAKIPLELVGTRTIDNVAIKTPVQAYTTATLKEGEPCTVVFYGEDGSVLSRSVLLTSVTTFTRPIEMGQRVITGIELISPSLASNNKNVLEVPLNETIGGLMLMCRVHFNDSYQDFPIDGTKVRLDGMDDYVATILGERIPLVLTYILSEEESSIVGSENVSRFIAKPYNARTVAADGAYALKLFPIPTWVNEFVGYEIEWYLYNADRKRAYYATPYVEWNPSVPPFRPLKYGTLQTLGVTVEVSKVDPTLNPHRHAQTLGITLMGDPLTSNTPWLIRYSQNAEQDYGLGLGAEFTFNKVGNWTLSLASGIPSLDLWLEQVYYRTQPLFIEGEEPQAPKPTHFNLILNDINMEFPIASWNKPLTVPTGMNVGESVTVQFIQRLPNVDLQLGSSPLTVKHLNKTKTF
jgi:hypothetical protein